MALSFKDSVKMNSEKTSNGYDATMRTATLSASPLSEDTSIPTVMSLNNEMPSPLMDEGWIRNDTIYEWDEEYHDSQFGHVDENKNITMPTSQFSVTQEKNSQYIPFTLNRYYDGVDLSTMVFVIHGQNNKKEEFRDTPINFEYNDTTIRFGWLLSEFACMEPGRVQFEIEAYGVNKAGKDYKWITRPSGVLNIVESLCSSGNGTVQPSDDWITQFLTQVTTKVSEAQNAANEAQAAASNAQDAANQAQSVVNDAKTELQASLNESLTTALSNYYTKAEVDALLADIDLTEVYEAINNIDGLANFSTSYDSDTRVLTFYNGENVIKTETLNSNPTAEWVTAYDSKMDTKIATAKSEVQGNLDAYKTTTDADLQAIHQNIDDLPQTLESDYYNKTKTDELLNLKADKTDVSSLNNEVSVIRQTADTNKSNIATVRGKIADLESELSGIDKSPSVTYDQTYDEEQILTLWEIQGEGTENEVRTAKSQNKILGGGGGGGTSSTLKIEYVTRSPLVVTTNDKALIKFIFSGTDSSGDEVLEGQATWKIGNTVIATGTVVSGENTFDATGHVNLGTQKITVSITDDAGSLVTKSWTVQKIDIKLESTFNDKLTYPIGNISFDYTPYGAISKDVHFILDGVELSKVTTASSGIPMSYTLPSQSHGAHLLEAYITAQVNNSTVESNHVVKDIIWYDPSNDSPVISCIQQNITAKQYDTTNIVYSVYDPKTENPTVTLAVDGNVLSTLNLDSNTQTWQYKTSDVGEHVLTITCRDTVKTLHVTVEKLDIEIEPVTAGLAFDFNPSGKSNNDTDRLWSSGDIAMSVSDNFDWVNGGYQIDENGDQYFCIKAGTSATINYKLFEDDAKRNGKEMKLVFKTTNVQSPDATFMKCLDNTTDSDHIGIKMDVHEARIYAQAGNLLLPYSENDIIEFEFNISKDTESVPMIMGYEDGVSSRPFVYNDSHGFTQVNPQIISLGSEYCDLYIYRFKVYNNSLTARNILNNFIADARNAEEMVARYNRNQIYDENGRLTPESLAAACPNLRVYKLSAPYFTNNKSDKVSHTTIQQIYKDGDPILDNWTCYNARHSGQGTSSNNYGAAGRNLDFIMNKSGIDGVKPYFVLGDGVTEAKKITLTRTSVPTNYLNAKVNIASSNNFTNAMLANRYNKYNPHNRMFIREEGVDTSFIKDTMEFYNCVVFIQETDPDISTHREFADNAYHFYAAGNIGDSKKTDQSRLTDPDDKYEFIVEVMDVELPLSDFPKDTMINAMEYSIDETTGSKKYKWATNENLGILYELINGEYVLTEDTAVDLSKTYYVDILEQDDFSEDYTYGWRYIYEDGTDEENAQVAEVCKSAWKKFYRFVTNSTDEEFINDFEKYFAVDSALYYYLFTTRYCMIDNRAKNLFFHFGKTGEYQVVDNPMAELLPIYCELSGSEYVPTTDTAIDNSKTYYTQYVFDLDFDYDNDSSMSLNNYGRMSYRYGLEDTDVDENGEEVFRESDSTFFCRIRDLFPNELRSLYNTLESKNAWHAESFLNEIEAWQNDFPEELWRLDIERKYIRTYNSSFINGAGNAEFLENMCNGKMKYSIKEWERSQEKYMASKYQSSLASSDNAVLRCTVPTGDVVVAPDYRVKLTPYYYMYLNVKYGGASPIQIRAVPGVEYTIPYTGDAADIVNIYSASCLQSLGDLSTCYPATVDSSRASRIKTLKVGNDTPGYDNPSFTALTLGANFLLEILNIENVSGLTQALNLSVLNNLKELYAHGSNVTGVMFANGGRIEIAELPAIGSLSMKNLLYLADLNVTSFDKLTTLTVENCSTVDVKNILDAAPNLNRVRITGINWNLDNTDLLDRIYAMYGIDKNGYNIPKSVLAGNVHVPVMREQKLADFSAAWSDLNITYDTLVNQFAVTFVNDDGTVLDVQYVDKGGDAVDPITREDNPIPIPTKESTVSTDFTYSGWDSSFKSIFSNRTITAQYTEAVRNYTVKHVANGRVYQEVTAPYGSSVMYEGDIPTYTAEESAYVFYLFNRWDQFGFVDGNKTINAIYDRFEYTEGCFDGMDISEMTPVQIYAMIKVGKDQEVVELKDSISFNMGNDFSYDNIQENVIVANETVFTGSNYIDTGIKLLETDQSWTLAVDYQWATGNTDNAVLLQCYQGDGSNGFKVWRSSQPSISWGTSSVASAREERRDILVLRHIKGETKLHIYKGNLPYATIDYSELNAVRATAASQTLVLGCSRADDGVYENYAKGTIYWCKLWNSDLGDSACRELVGWIHEPCNLEMAGFRRYYLSDGSGKKTSMTFLASTLLSNDISLNGTTANSGGFGVTSLSILLNQRFINAVPVQWRQLIKQCKIPTSAGNKSTEIVTSDCYVTVPSIIELDSSFNYEPYSNEGDKITYFTSNTSRIRKTIDGVAKPYWTRSPNVEYTSYYFAITETGYVDAYSYSMYEKGVLIEVSM